MLAEILEHLNMGRYLLPRADLSSFAANVIGNELITTATLLADQDLLASELRNHFKCCAMSNELVSFRT